MNIACHGAGYLGAGVAAVEGIGVSETTFCDAWIVCCKDATVSSIGEDGVNILPGGREIARRYDQQDSAAGFDDPPLRDLNLIGANYSGSGAAGQRHAICKHSVSRQAGRGVV